MEKISMKEAVNGLPVIHFHAAGIDVCSMLRVASYTGAAGEHCMCSSGCFTKDLKEPVEELKREGITDAALEATGVYRQSLYEMPEESDIKVTLINPCHYKNSGRSENRWKRQYMEPTVPLVWDPCVTRTSPRKHTGNCVATYTNVAWYGNRKARR
jgi:hypothetical protein